MVKFRLLIDRVKQNGWLAVVKTGLMLISVYLSYRVIL
jgi:hypothetical protein